MAKRVICSKLGCGKKTTNTKYKICSKCHCGKTSGRGICRQDPLKCKHNITNKRNKNISKNNKNIVGKVSEKYSGKTGGKRTGVIYGIVNPKFKGWVKLGYSKETGDSIVQRYNTHSPERDFRLIEQEWVSSKNKAEKRLHELAEKKSTERGKPSSKRASEWFKISQKDAKKLIQKVGKEF